MQSAREAAACFGQESMITLRAEGYEARIAPAAGGRLASLDWIGAGGSRPLLVPMDGQHFDPHNWPKAGAFPMIPFANRLATEGFSFRGKQVRPQPGPQGFALHGLAHRRPWQVITQKADFALLQLEHKPDDYWPWAFTAKQSIHLSEQGLSLTLSVRNDSSEPMPLSIGWHPYHPVERGFNAPELLMRAKSRHDLDLQGRAVETRSAPLFGMGPGETAAFSGWDGTVKLRTDAAGVTAITCSGTRRVVLHAPATGVYVCIEPVTQLPGHLGEALGEGRQAPSWTPALPVAATASLSWQCAWNPD